MSPSELVTWFVLASIAGWVFESLYSLLKTGRWEKRGFLFGPVCPIYGTGAAAAIVLFDNPFVEGGSLPAWAIFLICMTGSAVLEYAVSVALERLFGAVWWDYSDMPLNLNGRICLPASLLFGAAGLAVVYLVLPAIHQAEAAVPSFAFELFALAAVLLIGMDLATTVIALRDLMGKITAFDEQFNARMDEGAQHTRDAVRAARASLTRRQVRMLRHLRRFSSDVTRERAMELREDLKDRYERWRSR